MTSSLSRKFQIFYPLDFIAEITQHIPERGAHTIRYYGWYSNKARGMRAEDACSELAESAKQCGVTH